MVRRALLFLFPTLLAGCGPDYSPNTYASNAVQQANKVEQGVVVGVRPVDVSAAGTAGALTGGAAGGIAGAQIAGGSVGSAFGALGGTVVGGLVGTTIEHTTADTTAFEYIVRKPNDELVSVTQRDAAPMRLGQKVLVIAGAQARIVPDYTVPIPAEPKPARDTVATAPLPPPVQSEPLGPSPLSVSVAPAPVPSSGEVNPPPSPAPAATTPKPVPLVP